MLRFLTRTARWPALLCPGLALADTATSATQALDGGSALLRATGGLALVIALIFALAWVVRRLDLTRRHTRHLPYQILGSTAVGPRERLLLVSMGDNWLLIGVTAGGMRTLHTMPAGQMPDASTVTRFADALRQHRQARQAEPPAPPAP